jgi:hypothetical protein
VSQPWTQRVPPFMVIVQNISRRPVVAFCVALTVWAVPTGTDHSASFVGAAVAVRST